jgi:hypothetical protein
MNDQCHTLVGAALGAGPTRTGARVQCGKL